MAMKVTKYKVLNTSGYTRLNMLVDFVSTIDWVLTADNFISQFERNLNELHVNSARTQPKHVYQAHRIDDYTVEVWKHNSYGEKLYMTHRISKA